MKITVRQARDVDAPNAYAVGVDREIHTVHTNANGAGLWIDGRQIEGTCQWDGGRNPREAIRRYFERRNDYQRAAYLSPWNHDVGLEPWERQGYERE